MTAGTNIRTIAARGRICRRVWNAQGNAGLPLCPYVLMCVDLIGAWPFGRAGVTVSAKLSRHSHLKDGLSRPAGSEDDLTTVLFRNAMREREAEPSAFLLPLTNEGLEEAFANALRHTVAVVRDIYSHVLFTDVQRDGYQRIEWIHSRSLAGIEKQVVDCPLDLLTIELRGCMCRISVARREPHAFGIGVHAYKRDRAIQKRGHQLWRAPDT